MALVTCPCAFRLRSLAQNETSHTDILPRDVFMGSLYEILPRDLLQGEMLPTEFLTKEFLCRDLARRPVIEILCGNLVKESSDLVQRSFIESLNRDLPWRSLLERSLQESFQETSYRDLVQRFCQDTSYGDLVQRQCLEICCRDLAAAKRVSNINRT